MQSLSSPYCEKSALSGVIPVLWLLLSVHASKDKKHVVYFESSMPNQQDMQSVHVLPVSAMLDLVSADTSSHIEGMLTVAFCTGILGISSICFRASCVLSF